MVDSAAATAGKGLDNDRHADALSPRQLLIASVAAYEDFSLPPHALRENLLIDADTAHLPSGTVLQIGNDVRLRLMFQCEACGQLDIRQPGLAQKIGRRRGMLARVLAGGVIRCGDRIRNLGVLEPAWPDDWRERIVQVLDSVPRQCVIEYKHLARLAGVQSSYCRAFPRVIKNLGAHYAGKAVSSQSVSELPRWDGQGLFHHR
jgi:MOSC domain-containing protein YiiM